MPKSSLPGVPAEVRSRRISTASHGEEQSNDDETGPRNMSTTRKNSVLGTEENSREASPLASCHSARCSCGTEATLPLRRQSATVKATARARRNSAGCDGHGTSIEYGTGTPCGYDPPSAVAVNTAPISCLPTGHNWQKGGSVQLSVRAMSSPTAHASSEQDTRTPAMTVVSQMSEPIEDSPFHTLPSIDQGHSPDVHQPVCGSPCPLSVPLRPVAASGMEELSTANQQTYSMKGSSPTTSFSSKATTDRRKIHGAVPSVDTEANAKDLTSTVRPPLTVDPRHDSSAMQVEQAAFHTNHDIREDPCYTGHETARAPGSRSSMEFVKSSQLKGPCPGARNPEGRVSRTATSFTPEVSPALCELVHREVLTYLIPSLASLHRRRSQLRVLAECLEDAIRMAGEQNGHPYGALRFYIFGSVNMRTVLPDGDNDVTIEVDGLLRSPSADTMETTPCVTLTHTDEASNSNSSGSDASGTGVPKKDGSPSFVPCTTTSGGKPTSALQVTTDSSAGNKEGTMQLTTTVTGEPVLAPPAAICVAGGELLARIRDYLSPGQSPLYVDSLVHAEVRVLKLLMDDASYDVTIGQFGGVNCVRFLHEMDSVIGGQHLLKRTLLLLKSWCSYEAHVLGGQGGYIGSYAVTVMLIAMINTVEFLEDVTGDDVPPTTGAFAVEISPLVLLARFLKFYSFFDFERYCVTAFGPLRLCDITPAGFDLGRLEVPAAHSSDGEEAKTESYDRNHLGFTSDGMAALGHLVRRRAKPLLTVSGVRHFLHAMNVSREQERKQRYLVSRGRVASGDGLTRCEADDSLPSLSSPSLSKVSSVLLGRRGSAAEDAELVCPSCTTAFFPVRSMNVLDPLRWSSNMVRGVCRNHVQRIYRAFAEGVRMLGAASEELELDVSRRGVGGGLRILPSPMSLGSRESNSSGGGDDVGEPPMGSSGGSSHGGALGLSIAGPAHSRGGAGVSDSFVCGYPAPHSCLTVREAAVLQHLFGQTIAAIQKYSAINCPWKRDDAQAAGMPQCGGCQRPSVFCAPNVEGMCAEQFLFENRPSGKWSTGGGREQPHEVWGPLCDAVLPPFAPTGDTGVESSSPGRARAAEHHGTSRRSSFALATGPYQTSDPSAMSKSKYRSTGCEAMCGFPSCETERDGRTGMFGPSSSGYSGVGAVNSGRYSQNGRSHKASSSPHTPPSAGSTHKVSGGTQSHDAQQCSRWQDRRHGTSSMDQGQGHSLQRTRSNGGGGILDYTSSKSTSSTPQFDNGESGYRGYGVSRGGPSNLSLQRPSWDPVSGGGRCLTGGSQSWSA